MWKMQQDVCASSLVSSFVSGAGSNLPTVKSSDFTAASQFNSTVKYRVIRSSQRASYLRCAAACLKEEYCEYFSDTKDTRRCELSDDSIVSVNEEKLKYFKRNGDSPCFVEGPLGMEDGRIPDESITASSFYRNLPTYAPPRTRLYTQGSAAAWCYDGSEDSPWIQVNFNGTVTITGLITQGRGDRYNQWVTEHQVSYSDDAQSWDQVTDAFGTQIKFAGNSDRSTLVTARFPLALRTRILRIHPTAWNKHCSMRFEVIGCY
ncbi:lactadherin-like [Patiria miniata]|uniref:F5/8 type C domain-containing protein n=1 Tax=Patiria miniata TaxID=46514 RepID=A0A913Z9C3_PATMI|nr:lactadherin-like [Patiria miniata]